MVKWSTVSLIGTWGSFGTMGMNLELVTGVVDCLDIRTEIQQN